MISGLIESLLSLIISFSISISYSIAHTSATRDTSLSLFTCTTRPVRYNIQRDFRAVSIASNAVDSCQDKSSYLSVLHSSVTSSICYSNEEFPGFVMCCLARNSGVLDAVRVTSSSGDFLHWAISPAGSTHVVCWTFRQSGQIGSSPFVGQMLLPS